MPNVDQLKKMQCGFVQVRLDAVDARHKMVANQNSARRSWVGCPPAHSETLGIKIGEDFSGELSDGLYKYAQGFRKPSFWITIARVRSSEPLAVFLSHLPWTKDVALTRTTRLAGSSRARGSPSSASSSSPAASPRRGPPRG